MPYLQAIVMQLRIMVRYGLLAAARPLTPIIWHIQATESTGLCQHLEIAYLQVAATGLRGMEIYG
jgi:hypothetical protein